MTQAPRGPVVIDTGVFGAQLTPRTWPLGELYRPLVEGRAALISFITVGGTPLRCPVRRVGATKAATT
jgi:hypothetical protein